MTEIIYPFSHRFLLLLVSFLLCLSVISCNGDGNSYSQGYIEGDYLYIASPIGGRVVAVHAQRGGIVNSGDVLFELDPAPEQLAHLEAVSIYNAARAMYDDKRSGMRDSEIAAIKASIAQVEASLSLSKKELRRIRSLYERQTVNEKVLDVAIASYERDLAMMDELRARLRTARLGARRGQAEAARSDMQRAGAHVELANWRLEQMSPRAPMDARVVDILYSVGEVAPPAYPVVVLLPPEAVKVRFFVKEPLMPDINLGDMVSVMVDGRATPVDATVSYISPEAEYTPPFIYSKENREKFVFMVEAVFTPEAAAGLHPGLPVDVRMLP